MALSVTQATPADGAVEVSATPTIQVVFNTSVVASTVRSSNFLLSDEYGVSIPITLSTSSATVTATTETDLHYGRAYTFTILYDTMGPEGDDSTYLDAIYQVSFTITTTTESGTSYDDVASSIFSVSSVSPTDESYGKNITEITVVFDAAPVSDVSDYTTVTITDLASGSTISAAPSGWTLTVSGSTLTVIPAGSYSFVPNAVYTITLDSTLPTLDDTATLGTDYTFSFGTIVAPLYFDRSDVVSAASGVDNIYVDQICLSSCSRALRLWKMTGQNIFTEIPTCLFLYALTLASAELFGMTAVFDGGSPSRLRLGDLEMSGGVSSKDMLTMRSEYLQGIRVLERSVKDGCITLGGIVGILGGETAMGRAHPLSRLDTDRHVSYLNKPATFLTDTQRGGPSSATVTYSPKGSSALPPLPGSLIVASEADGVVTFTWKPDCRDTVQPGSLLVEVRASTEDWFSTADTFTYPGTYTYELDDISATYEFRVLPLDSSGYSRGVYSPPITKVPAV